MGVAVASIVGRLTVLPGQLRFNAYAAPLGIPVDAPVQAVPKKGADIRQEGRQSPRKPRRGTYERHETGESRLGDTTSWTGACAGTERA